MTSRSEQSSLAQLLLAVQRLYASAPSGLDDLPTALPWLSLVRRATSTPVGRGMLQPSVCLLVQENKEMLVGDRVLRKSSLRIRLAANERVYSSSFKSR
jgi:hypothetical protein